MSSFEDSVLRVLKGDSVVGAAFLVSARLVVTCAHVVESAGAKAGGEIALCLSDGTLVEAVVEPEFWRDPNREDVAILRLKENIDHAAPLLLGASSGISGHSFSTFGFPRQGQELAATGEIVGQAAIQGIKVLQLRSTEVTPGFSGAPVFDNTTRRVVGMVVAISPPDEYQRLGTTAFAIRSEAIREICTELQLSEICPYRSLDVFNEEDAQFFFGRERVVQKMIDSLKREPRFLAVLGPSGSGKSSAVRAGLTPELRRGRVPGSDKWGIITIRPTHQPFEQLDAAGLSKSAAGIEIAVRSWLDNHPGRTRLVLMIDQFEELLVSTPEDVCEKFIRELASLLDAPLAITVVLTLRDDFYSRFLQRAASLAGRLERGLVNIPPTLEPEELRAMIAGPAQKVGLMFEEGLVADIINDATEAGYTKGMARSTILPLLEFALTELWEKRQENQITHQAYDALGGVTGGLAQWADQAFYDLTENQRIAARHVLTELVRLGDETEGLLDTRRRLPLGEFGESEEVLQVVKHFADRRLLVTSSVKGREYVEIIHDMLVREWEHLQGWLRENREFFAWRQSIEESVGKWNEDRSDESYLFRGVRLAEAEKWASAYQNELGALEQDFINAGIELRERELHEAEEKRQLELYVVQKRAEEAEEQRKAEELRAQKAENEARKASRRSKLLRNALIISIVLFALSAIGFGWYYTQQPRVLAGDLNIAIAPFMVIDESGAVNSGRSRSIGLDLSYFIADRIRNEIGQNADFNIEVANTSITVSEAAEAARLGENLNADLIFYGVIRENGDEIQISPRLFLGASGCTNDERRRLFEIALSRLFARPYIFSIDTSSNLQLQTRFAENLIGPAINVCLGEMYLTKGDLEGAIQHFQNAEQSTSTSMGFIEGADYIDVLLGNTYILMAGQEFDEDTVHMAEAYFQRALAIDPENPWAIMGLADVSYFMALGGVDPALSTESSLKSIRNAGVAYQEILDLVPPPEVVISRYQNADYETVKAYLGQGRVALAEALLAEGPSSPKLSQARSIFEEVVLVYESGNDSIKDLACHANAQLGQIAIIENRTPDAVDYYKKAISLCDSAFFKASYSAMLGDAYEKIGQTAEAMAAYAAAIQYETNPEIERKYQQKLDSLSGSQ